MLYHAGHNPPRVGLHASRLLDGLSAGRIHKTHAEIHLLVFESLLRWSARRATLTCQNTYVRCFTEIERYQQICPAEVPKLSFRVTGYLVPT